MFIIRQWGFGSYKILLLGTFTYNTVIKLTSSMIVNSNFAMFYTYLQRNAGLDTQHSIILNENYVYLVSSEEHYET